MKLAGARIIAHNGRFNLFATPEHTRAWERGKLDALTGK